MKIEIIVGEYYLVKDFENGARPVKVIDEAIEIGEGVYWCRYSDGSVYDFEASQLLDPNDFRRND